jgi:hypothetical protein
MKSSIWISYDLGVRGDYPSLYAWLDEKGAKECGDSVAFLQYNHSGDIEGSLRSEIGAAITTDKRTRIYVVYRDRTANKNRGSFIFGGRRAAPWTGFSSNSEGTTDEEA